ncbi:hypothetical protein L9F63_021116, partial [Diploptera punctata]
RLNDLNKNSITFSIFFATKQVQHSGGCEQKHRIQIPCRHVDYLYLRAVSDELGERSHQQISTMEK